MGDPLAPAAAGDTSPFFHRLDTVNTVLERVRALPSPNKVRVGATGAETEPVDPRCTVYVRNDTGGTLPEFSVVKLGTPLISAVDAPFAVQRQPLFPGTAPASASDAFAILLEPLTADKIGRATVLGVAICDLLVNDNAHGYAAPSAALTAAMESAAMGPAKIIWKNGTSGTVRAVVLLQGEMGDVSPLTTKGDIYTHDASADARLPVGTNGQVLVADSGETTGLKWSSAAGTGDVVGPAGATDNAVARFDGATGKLIQNSTVTASDIGEVEAYTLTLVGGNLELTQIVGGGGGPLLEFTAPGTGATAALFNYTRMYTDPATAGSIQNFLINVEYWDAGWHTGLLEVGRGFRANGADGANGTLPDGSTITGGLVTTIGSGTFATVADIDDAIDAYQPLDADLTALAALSGTNTIYYRSGASTWTAVTVGTGLDFTAGSLTATGVTDHGALTGLSDDDHTQYALLAGRGSGQTLSGGTGAGDGLVLQGTSHGSPAGAQVVIGNESVFALREIATPGTPGSGGFYLYPKTDKHLYCKSDAGTERRLTLPTELGTVTTGVWNGTKVAEAYGGTNQTTYTTGDLLYSSAANTLAKLPGNTTTTGKFLRQVGNGGAVTATSWEALASADIASLVVPASLASAGWSTVVAYLASNQALTQNAYTQITIDTETTDVDSQFNTSTNTFTPATTGTYLITFQSLVGGSAGRLIGAIRQSTTVVAVFADGTLIGAGGTLQVPLTGGTAYNFAVYTTTAAVSALGGAANTFIAIRRLY